MKEKVKRILDLIRTGKLGLDDAAPLLAALNPRLALVASDQDLIRTLLDRPDLDTDQIAEHLLLLRGVKGSAVPAPPQAPSPPRRPQIVIGGRVSAPHTRSLDDLGDRIAAKLEQAAEQLAAKAERLGQNVEDHMREFAQDMERAVDSWDAASSGAAPAHQTTSRTRILRIQVESEDGDSYHANLPLSLAPHLDKLIPAHGVKALQKSGFSLEALQLLIESGAPSGELIRAEDSDGNSIQLILQ